MHARWGRGRGRERMWARRLEASWTDAAVAASESSSSTRVRHGGEVAASIHGGSRRLRTGAAGAGQAAAGVRVQQLQQAGSGL